MTTFKNKIESDEVRKFIRWLKVSKQSFTISSTGYSKLITWNENKYSFIPELTSPGVFYCHSKIKKDIKEGGVVLADIPFCIPQYFFVTDRLRQKFVMPDKVWLVDISAAYLTCLHNHKFISDETFKACMKLPKVDRLKAVGMLATTRLTMEFENGTLKRHHVKSEDFYKNYFFFACNEIGELLNKAAQHYGNAFLFFWVDGIYVTKRPETAERIFREAGYKCKHIHLTDCALLQTKENITFACNENGNEKEFTVPFEEPNNKVNLINYLKHLKNELANTNVPPGVEVKDRVGRIAPRSIAND